MYGDDLIAYVESREQSLASTSYTHDAPPINAAHASGIPNTQLLGVVEEVFVHAWADIVQEGIVQRWTRKVASAFTTSVTPLTRIGSLGGDSLVGVEDSISNVAEDTGASSSSSSALDIHAPSQHSHSIHDMSEGSIASTAPLFIPNAEMAVTHSHGCTPSPSSMSSGIPLPVPNAEMVRGGDMNAGGPALSAWIP